MCVFGLLRNKRGGEGIFKIVGGGSLLTLKPKVQQTKLN